MGQGLKVCGRSGSELWRSSIRDVGFKVQGIKFVQFRVQG